jgi:hypothetical protein
MLYGLMGDGVVAPVVRYLAAHILEPLLKAPSHTTARQTRLCGAAEAREGEELLREMGL